MQGKVSMVITCYNKASYIGNTFDSIIAQKWDNIELILVNDGSTDGTREVITQYEPKFLQRGYEVLIVDQGNAGVCTAAKTGLDRITGDYVCCVDADDELDPEYVSSMAEWLETHCECDFCMCGRSEYEKQGELKQIESLFPLNTKKELEQLLLLRIENCIWIYLVRTSYFTKCRIVENYSTDRVASHEPSFNIPLYAYKGNYKVINKSLYYFNRGADGHSKALEIEKRISYRLKKTESMLNTLDSLPDSVLSPLRKRQLKNVALAGSLMMLCGIRNEFTIESLDMFLRLLECPADINISRVTNRAWQSKSHSKLLSAAIKCKIGDNIGSHHLNAKRIIAYGVLGQRGKAILPRLKHTPLEPDLLWDIAGDASMLPIFNTLTQDDVVFILPKGLALDFSPARSISYEMLNEMLNDERLLYPEFFKSPNQD